MTTPAAPAEPADSPATAPAADPAPEIPTTPTESDSPNSEAAKYRVKLRETETERDTLTTRLGALQRRECEAAIAELLEVPGDLWDLGQATPGDFYSDTDELNTDELRAAAAALLQSRPGLAKQRRFDGPHNWGQTSDPMPAASSSWNQVIGNR